MRERCQGTKANIYQYFYDRTYVPSDPARPVFKRLFGVSLGYSLGGPGVEEKSIWRYRRQVSGIRI